MTKHIRNRAEIIGKKLGMTQYFNEEGNAVPVTVIELAENIVTDIKTKEKNGYSSIQIGAKVKPEKKFNKAQIQAFKKKDLPLLSFLKEFRINADEAASYKIGESVDFSKVITQKEFVDVTGISIGKGFQGMVKLYNKQRGAKSHGSKHYRGPGSIGAHTFPGRVLPGKKMPSMMGNENVTVRNLEVIDFNKETNILLIKGAVPGTENSMLTIRTSIKNWNAAK